MFPQTCSVRDRGLRAVGGQAGSNAVDAASGCPRITGALRILELYMGQWDVVTLVSPTAEATKLLSMVQLLALCQVRNWSVCVPAVGVCVFVFERERVWGWVLVCIWVWMLVWVLVCV